MELSGTVLRQVTCSYYSCSHGVGPRRRGGGGRVSMGPTRVMGSSGFCDEGHVRYYSSPRCGGKDKEIVVLTTKKKLKLLKAMSQGLSVFPQFAFHPDPRKRAFFDHLQGNLNTDGAQLLIKQLEQLRAEEKEMKRKMKKEKKAKRKASKMKTGPDCESSSSSSESSESECDDEVVDMDNLRVGVAPVVEVQPTILSLPPLLPQTTVVQNPREDATANDHAMELCSRNDTCVNSISASASFKDETCAVTTAPQKRIEVCMGNKCKRSGAAALFQEFERVVGMEGGAVVGCKCMGKCKSAPNVRIQNYVNDSVAKGLDDLVQIPPNPLCIGVALEDVDAIVASFLGENQENMVMAAAVTS